MRHGDVDIQGELTDDEIIKKTTTTMTRYVDGTDGTDDTSHGTGTGVNAWKTIGYAVSQIPKYLAHDVTINVADDVYLISSSINVHGFVGNGLLTIQGNASATPTDGSYDIDTGANNIHAFYLEGNSAYIRITGFYIDSDSQDYTGIYIENSGYVRARYCRIHNFDYGVRAVSSSVAQIQYCDLDDNDYGIQSESNSNIWSYDNSSSTNNDAYGLRAYGALIMKFDATQPGGDSGAEQVQVGGVIR